jgi:RNA polymerase sigma-70 factor (ECF subfamily)
MEQALSVEDDRTVSVDRTHWSEAVGDLFDSQHGRLYALALRLTWNADEARDLVQESFLRVIERGRMPDDERAAERWLVRILVNLCRDRARRLSVRRRFAGPAPDEPPSPHRDPESDLAVRIALGALPVRQRAVVVLHEMEGRTLEEVAALLGIAAVTARWHLHVARKKLREALTR